MFCEQCGASMSDNAKFCPACGAQRAVSNSTQSQGSNNTSQGYQNYNTQNQTPQNQTPQNQTPHNQTPHNQTPYYSSNRVISAYAFRASEQVVFLILGIVFVVLSSIMVSVGIDAGNMAIEMLSLGFFAFGLISIISSATNMSKFRGLNYTLYENNIRGVAAAANNHRARQNFDVPLNEVKMASANLRFVLLSHNGITYNIICRNPVSASNLVAEINALISRNK